jgi:hypothetical protein
MHIISYSNKVKEHSVHQTQFLLPNHRVVLSCCTQALAFIELPVDNVKQSRVQLFTCSASFCQKRVVAKMLMKQTVVTFFKFGSVFQRFVTHS